MSIKQLENAIGPGGGLESRIQAIQIHLVQGRFIPILHQGYAHVSVVISRDERLVLPLTEIFQISQVK